jgi:electron transport complex protein RnfE
MADETVSVPDQSDATDTEIHDSDIIDSGKGSKDYTEYKELTWQGLWKNNAALVQLLGLCPLLAVTGSVVNGLGLGIATTLVLLGSNCTVSLVRHYVPNEIRIPIFVLVIATFVTIVQLLMNAFTYNLYQALGIFIPLIVTNCAIIGRAEAYASKNPLKQSAYDGFIMGMGFLIVLVVLGAMRELLGNGTLFDGMHLLLGDWAKSLKIVVFNTESPFLLAILPPGAFLGMGLLIALKNLMNNRIEKMVEGEKQQKVVTRARVTTETT